MLSEAKKIVYSLTLFGARYQQILREGKFWFATFIKHCLKWSAKRQSYSRIVIRKSLIQTLKRQFFIGIIIFIWVWFSFAESSSLKTPRGRRVISFWESVYIIFQILICNPLSFRRSYQMCSVKKAALKNVAIFTGKHLCWSLFLLELQA